MMRTGDGRSTMTRILMTTAMVMTGDGGLCRLQEIPTHLSSTHSIARKVRGTKLVHSHAHRCVMYLCLGGGKRGWSDTAAATQQAGRAATQVDAVADCRRNQLSIRMFCLLSRRRRAKSGTQLMSSSLSRVVVVVALRHVAAAGSNSHHAGELQGFRRNFLQSRYRKPHSVIGLRSRHEHSCQPLIPDDEGLVCEIRLDLVHGVGAFPLNRETSPLLALNV